MAKLVSELNNGGTLYQVTDDSAPKNNVYCEGHYCTTDSSSFIYQRKIGGVGPKPWQFEAEFVMCDFGTWTQRVVARGLSFPMMGKRDSIYFTRRVDDQTQELVCTNIASGDSRVIHVDGGVSPGSGMTLSSDERFLAYGVPVSFDPQMFGIELVDLTNGTKRMLLTDPDIFNAHPQFNPGNSRQLLVQHNRGSKFDRDGKCLLSKGKQGTTLFVANVDDGEITPLAIGPPHTVKCSGHEQWIGDSGEVLLTVALSEQDVATRQSLYRITPGSAATLACNAVGFNHVHVSACGRFFCCDDTASHEIFVGSLRTRRYEFVCSYGPLPQKAYEQFGQASHAHAYLSPDLKWMVFNSCRTGRPEIHVTSIPPTLFERLESDSEQNKLKGLD